MRKILLLTLVSGMLMGSVALAAETGPGCGLGKLVFDGKKGILFHTLAWTTNGLFGNKTFAITTGTSGCDADAVILREKEQEVFVAVNLDNLSQEMAQGQGQYVDAMANLMGCESGVYAEFGRTGQAHYESIFASAEPDTTMVLSAMKRELSSNPVLAAGCTRLS